MLSRVGQPFAPGNGIEDEKYPLYELRYLGIIVKKDNYSASQKTAWVAVHKGIFLPKGITFNPDQSIQESSNGKNIPSMWIPYSLDYPVVEGAINSFEWYYYSFKASGALEIEKNAHFVLCQTDKRDKARHSDEMQKVGFIINRAGRIFPIYDGSEERKF